MSHFSTYTLCPIVLLAISPALAQEAPPQPEAKPTTPTTAEAAPSPLPAEVTPEPAPEPPPPAPIEPQVPAAQPSEEEAAPPSDRVSVGKDGFWQPSALLQFWAFYSRETTGPSSSETRLTFRPRRVELRAKGDIVQDLVAYAAMIDPARVLDGSSATIEVEGQEPVPTTPGTVTVNQPASTALSALQDLLITFKSPYVDVSGGQFKIPVSLEGYGSSSKLLFPERALVSRQFGDRRDVGLRFEKKLGDVFYYYAGVFNGEGQNRLDGDRDKDVSLRLEVYPIKGLTIGAVGYTTVGDRDRARDRVEGDLRYDENNVIFLFEYIRAWDKSAAGATKVTGQGAYGALGYTVAGFQPIARVGFLDTDADLDGNQVAHYEAGLNYYIQKQEARLSLALSLFDPQGGDNSRVEGILAAQVSF